MSDPVAKANCSAAKDARQAPTPDIEPKHKSRKKQCDVIVEYRLKKGYPGFCLDPTGDKWKQWFKKYSSIEVAETAIKNLSRKYPYDFRVKNHD